MLTMRFPEGRRRALTLSYDDGVEQDVRLLEILNRAGIKCTFNLNSGCFPPEGNVWPKGQIHRRVTRSVAQSLYGKDGHEVAVHTLTHPDLTFLPLSEMTREIHEDRRNLEALYGTMVRGAAYPFGTYSDDVVEALRMCGIVYCRTVEASHGFRIPADWLRLKATCHHNDPQLPELCEKFFQGGEVGAAMLFYLWGHAYEFEANDNWQVIEDFAARMGGHDNVWYATNLAICDYVHAWGELQFSADGHRVYNPTVVTLWALDAANQTVILRPGEERMVP